MYNPAKIRKVVIAGSRGITNYAFVEIYYRRAMDEGWAIQEIVSGGAKGVDRLGERLAKEYELHLERFIPDWRPNGVLDKGAGLKRNAEMAEYCDGAIIVHDGKSTGTANMLAHLRRLDKPYIYVVVEDGESDAVIHRGNNEK